jgi:hypothetical protein
VEIDVPRDRDGTFEPAIVRNRQRRPDGIEVIETSANAGSKDWTSWPQTCATRRSSTVALGGAGVRPVLRLRRRIRNHLQHDRHREPGRTAALVADADDVLTELSDTKRAALTPDDADAF